MGGPLTLDVGERRDRGTANLALAARGFLDVHQALREAGATDANPQLTGTAEWTGQLSVPLHSGSDRVWSARADSSLAGLASALPEPLAKSPDSTLPLHIYIHGSEIAA